MLNASGVLVVPVALRLGLVTLWFVVKSVMRVRGGGWSVTGGIAPENTGWPRFIMAQVSECPGGDTCAIS